MYVYSYCDFCETAAKKASETDKIVNVKEKYNIFVVRCVIIETN